MPAATREAVSGDGHPLRVLAIEDSALDARLLQELLRDAGSGRAHMTHMRTLAAGAEELAHRRYDCVLLDLGLPDGDGVENVERIRAADREVAIVVLTGRDDDASALEALRRGAQEYAIKGAHSGEELLRIVQHAIERHRLMAALSSEREQEYYRATHDPLTSLPNRQLFLDRAAMALNQVERCSGHLAICFIDLDGFKPINDRHGHAVGDALLREVARVLRETVREGDTVARVGGDEFVVLMASVPDRQETEAITRRLIARLSAIDTAEGRGVKIGASAGIALYPEHGDTLQQLMINADLAMYQAKRAGRGTLRVYGPPSSTGNLEAPGGSLDENALTLCYQPWVGPDGQHIGLEVYVRPVGGSGRAAEVLQQASQHAWLESLGRWVMLHACRQWLALRSQGLAPALLSVNVAEAELDTDTFAESRLAILEQCGMPLNHVAVEVTERAFEGEGHAHRIEQLRALQDRGVRVFLDNFGRDSGALRRLAQLPISGVKLDSSVLHEMREGEPAARILASSSVGLARALGQQIIITGVENADDYANALSLGPSGLQGRQLAPPSPASQLGPPMAAGGCTENTN